MPRDSNQTSEPQLIRSWYSKAEAKIISELQGRKGIELSKTVAFAESESFSLRTLTPAFTDAHNAESLPSSTVLFETDRWIAPTLIPPRRSVK